MTTSEATNCSWDPTEALLECTLSSESAALSLTKQQTEATRTLKLICSDSNSSYTSIRNDNYSILSNLQVHYDRRRLKPWPHLLRLHIEKCPLASISPYSLLLGAICAQKVDSFHIFLKDVDLKFILQKRC